MKKTVLILILMVLVLVSVGILFWQKNNTSQIKDALHGGIVVTNSDETVNWKTYRNDKYNYEIKYPQDWTTRTMGQSALPATAQDRDVGFVGNNCFMWVSGDSNDGEVSDLLNKGYTETKVMVDGLPARKLEKLTDHGAMRAVYFTSSKGVPFRIDSEGGQANNLECVNRFNQFISTFKFTK
ncbi:MAG: PsbP-related protein [Candidatus Doudnabacteria bacterium]